MRLLPHVGAKFEVGRIIAQAKVTNLTDASKFVQCGMLVDTGAAGLILPAAWRDRLGAFPREEQVALVLANGEVVQGFRVCASGNRNPRLSAGRQRGDVR